MTRTALTFPSESHRPRPADDLARGIRLSIMQGREIDPRDVMQTLSDAGIKAVLVGGHAVNACTGKPRATVDVDVIADKPRKAADAISKRFPHLLREDHPVVIRFKDGQHEAIDIIRPESAPLFKRVLKLTQQLRLGKTTIVLPAREAMLALKFAAMLMPSRKIEDRYIDARDFTLIAKSLKTVDTLELHSLGELVSTDGGKELCKLVKDARAGRRLEF